MFDEIASKVGGLISLDQINDWAERNEVSKEWINKLSLTQLNHCMQVGKHPVDMGYHFCENCHLPTQ